MQPAVVLSDSKNRIPSEYAFVSMLASGMIPDLDYGYLRTMIWAYGGRLRSFYARHSKLGPQPCKPGTDLCFQPTR